MGFSYIYSQAKSHTKAWNDQFVLAAHNLFANTNSPIERTFVAVSGSRINLTEGDAVHVRRVGDQLMVYQGLTPLAVADKPALALFEIVDAAHGVVAGAITEVIDSANLILIKVTEGVRK